MMVTSSREEAVKIIRILIHERLIACANIIGGISSIFWWKGEVDEIEEYLVFMKSHKVFFKKILEVVKKNHSYEVPEVVALPIIDGLSSYIKWLGDSLKQGDDSG
jgi:periplasmic divalent cation tolerance protein